MEIGQIENWLSVYFSLYEFVNRVTLYCWKYWKYIFLLANNVTAFQRFKIFPTDWNRRILLIFILYRYTVTGTLIRSLSCNAGKYRVTIKGNALIYNPLFFIIYNASCFSHEWETVSRALHRNAPSCAI